MSKIREKQTIFQKKKVKNCEKQGFFLGNLCKKNKIQKSLGSGPFSRDGRVT